MTLLILCVVQAQEDTEVLKSVVMPLEEEIVVLKSKLREASNRLEELEGKVRWHPTDKGPPAGMDWLYCSLPGVIPPFALRETQVCVNCYDNMSATTVAQCCSVFAAI